MKTETKKILTCPKCGLQNVGKIVAYDNKVNHISFEVCKDNVFIQHEIDRCLNDGHPPETIITEQSKIC